MSVLDKQFDYRPSAEKRAAREIIGMTKQVFEMMVSAFNRGSQTFWNNNDGATPQQIAAELGVDAREIFELHAQLGQLIATIKPDEITDGLSVVGEFEYNEDGSITVQD
jgi:hypothetical protein